jgi:catechol 2,3-dioxygenase-like lactoylglutathione lyase family enzyme
MRSFYVTYFGGESSEKYVNPGKGFESYFIRFGHSAALEIMSRTDITSPATKECTGFCHVAFNAGTVEAVHGLTRRLREDGFRVFSEPRTTGDGFFESVIGDPDGNRVEIVA